MCTVSGGTPFVCAWCMVIHCMYVWVCAVSGGTWYVCTKCPVVQGMCMYTVSGGTQYVYGVQGLVADPV
jgi:hypothetical protein